MERLPLNRSGKVGRKALPEPDLAGGRVREVEPPRNGKDQVIADAWCRVFGVESVSVRK
jgi:hypothetical protein